LTAATGKSKLTHAVKLDRTSMNAKLAKKLRKIARGVGLDVRTRYGASKPVEGLAGPRRCDLNGTLPPMVMLPSHRRAYKEAKKIYKGLPETRLEPKNG
jgi:hypothetical protein